MARSTVSGPLNILDLGLSPLTRRQFLAAGLALGLAPTFTGCADDARVLNFYNWANYVGEETIPGFERSTGIRVNYENYPSQDVLFAKLKIGLTGYDLAVASDYMVRRMVAHKLLAPLEGVQGLERLSAKFREADYDPGHRHSVPYLWGTTGMAYNRSKIHPAPTSLAALWDRRYADRIGMLSEKRDTIGIALLKLGYSGNSVKPAELDAALKALLEQKPLVRKYTSDMIDDLVRAEIHLACGYSGDVGQAHDAKADVMYTIAEEGGFLFVDNLCVPAGAPHYENAIRFVNHVLKPEVAAEITNVVSYPNAVEASLPMIRKDLLDNPLGYPPARMLERCSFQADLGEQEHRLWDPVWEQLKIES